MTNLIKRRVTFGPFEADLNTGELRKSGVKLKLGGQPFDILGMLLQRPGELVTRDELQKKIWTEDTFVDFNHGLNAAVNKLRDTLGDSADEPRYIETVPRRGYRFIGSVVEPEPAQQPESVSAPARPGPSSPAPGHRETADPAPDLAAAIAPEEVFLPSTPSSPAKSKRWVLRLTAGTLAALFVVFVGFQFVDHFLNPSELREHVAKLLVESAAGGSPGIWRLDLAHANPNARKLVISGGGRNEGPQLSADGKRLAFMSDRSGIMEIWTSDADGSHPLQLTSMGPCGSPQWSPDGRWIAFDSTNQNSAGVFFISAEGGPITTHVDLHAESVVPRWSRDGKWIYFSSARGDVMQIWKAPIAGGHASQVTIHGGFAPTESYDGKTLYYAKHSFPNPEVWEVPVSGGEEKLVSPLLRPSWWANWAVTETGILFVDRDGGEQTHAIEFYDFVTGSVRPVSNMEKASFWLSASPDGKSVWYTQQGTAESLATVREGEQ
jgi:DNA-binding winged helix-turn-helix (wHTH) protein